MIFTLPHELNPLWLANVPVMTTRLFQAVRDTLSTLLAAPKYLGPSRHPRCPAPLESDAGASSPRHCLVTGGGLTADGAWQAVRNGFLLPARVVMAVFRGKMLDALRRALPGTRWGCRRRCALNSFLIFNRLGHPTKTRWNVHLMERYAHGAGG